jgi:hypothetical protein
MLEMELVAALISRWPGPNLGIVGQPVRCVTVVRQPLRLWKGHGSTHDNAHLPQSQRQQSNGDPAL